MIGLDSSNGAIGLGVVLGGRGGTTAQLGGTLTGMPGLDNKLASDSVGSVVLFLFSAGSPLSSLFSIPSLKSNKNLFSYSSDDVFHNFKFHCVF